MRRFMIICALLGACIIAFAAQQSKADQPQKPAQQPKVDFTVNYAVESNYNTADLRKQLFDKKDTTVMVVSHRGDWHGTAENSLHAIQKAIEKGLCCRGGRREKDPRRLTRAHGRRDRGPHDQRQRTCGRPDIG